MPIKNTITILGLFIHGNEIHRGDEVKNLPCLNTIGRRESCTKLEKMFPISLPADVAMMPRVTEGHGCSLPSPVTE